MKNLKKIICTSLLTILLCFTAGCNKNDDDNNNEALPPATQTGAGTFACKVNGQNYIDTSGGYFNCFYQLVDGEYIFSIRGNDEVGMLTTIRLGLFNLELNERLYLLSENTIGNAWAGARFLLNINSSELSTTSTQNSGELIITKFDDINNIVSGTFWFNVENPYTGELVEIREGRFDTLFTQ